MQDYRTISDIYSELPSPPRREAHKDGDAAALHRIDGLRSVLYRYQCDSIAAMLNQETAHAGILDPLYIPLVGIDQTTFYIQPTTMEVLRECPVIVPAQGGILCEDMGMWRIRANKV